MATRRHLTKKQLLTGVIVGVVALTLSIWVFAIFGPSPQTAAPSTDNTEVTTPAGDEPTTPEIRDDVPAEEPAVTVDPATVARIEVAQLELSVAYTKGIPGFGFSVERTASGVRYVEFASDTLIGTKCTNDEGAFASIIVNPSDQDVATLTSTKKIEDTTYGLSLPDVTCTGDTDLFARYQAAFRDGFSLLERRTTDTV